MRLPTRPRTPRVPARVAVVLVLLLVVGCSAAPPPAAVSSGRTPAPSPTSTPTPVFPDAATTGVPDGVTLTPYTGPTRITRAGTVIDGALVTQPLVVVAGADDVTIRNSVVRAQAAFLVLNNEGAKNLQVVDTELDGQGHPQNNAGVAGDHFTLTRVDIHGTVDGVKLGSDVTIQDSWIHDLTVTEGSHNDGVQSLGSDNAVIRRNTVVVPAGSTSAIILSTGSASSMRDVVIDSNLLGGGSFTVYGGYEAGVDDASKVSGIVISNNRITTTVSPRGGSFGPFTSVSGPAVTLSHNVWHDGPEAGREVNHPARAVQPPSTHPVSSAHDRSDDHLAGANRGAGGAVDLTAFLGALVRRWYIVVIGLALTGGGIYLVLDRVPPTYDATGTVLVLPPRAATEGANPLLQLDGLGQPTSLVVAYLASDATREEFARRFPNAEYDVVVDRGPLITFTMNDPDRAEVVEALEAVVAEVPTTLRVLEDRTNAPASARLSSIPLTVDSVPKVNMSGTWRALAATAGIGLVGTLLLAVGLDRFLRQPRHR